jgi:hypothetical protein
VRLRACGPLVEGTAQVPAGAAEPEVRPVVRDGLALVARFLEAQLGPAGDPASMRDLVKLGLVERDCLSGVAAPPGSPRKR